MFTIPCWQAEEAVVGVPGLVRQQGHHAGHIHTAQQGDEDEGLKGKGDDDNDVGDGYYDYNNMLDYNDEEDNDDYNDDDSDDDNDNDDETNLKEALHSHLECSITRFELRSGPGRTRRQCPEEDDIFVLLLRMLPPPQNQVTKPNLEKVG